MVFRIKYTSASLTINEKPDPSVRSDFESFFNQAVSENTPCFLHEDEGRDDMPAHLKISILGCSLTIPITDEYLAGLFCANTVILVDPSG